MKTATAIYEDLERRDLLEMVADIALRHSALVDEVLGRCKSPRIAIARQAVWYALRHHSEAKWSYPDIGRLFGRDHSTVILGVRAYAAWLASRREDAVVVAEAAE